MKENEESKHEGMNMEKNNIPILTIVRGFPGSGKTTFGRKLAAKQNGLFVEPDMFLYDRDGKYNYTKEEFADAIGRSILTIRDYFTNGGKWAVYADVLPKKARVIWVSASLKSFWSCDFRVHDMPKITYEESKARNVHGVCEEDLKRMFAEWEDWQ